MLHTQSSPRRPLQLHNPSVHSPDTASVTHAGPSENDELTSHDKVDLVCYESMPAPSELAQLVQIAQFAQPSQPAQFAPNTCPAPSSAGLCWCLDPCVPDRICRNMAPPARKRKASPSPPDYQSGDDTWTQHIRIFHPTNFSYTAIEMDCNRPLHAIFHELCADQRVERKSVNFVWIRKRRRGGVQQVKLSDEDAPWRLGMREGVLETIECEFC